MTTRASVGVRPRSATTNRRTLAYRAEKPWPSTRSCQMAIALRPRPSASTISSRYGSQALALGARPGRTAARSVDPSGEIAGFGGSESVDTSDEMAGLAGPGSVDTCGGEMAGFAFASVGRPGPRTAILAAFR